MRESSNPVFRSLPKGQGSHAQFGTGAAGYGTQAVHTDPYVTQYPDQRQTGVSRPLTIDDVVTKTGITLAVLTALAAVSYFLVGANPALAMPLYLVGMIGGIAMLLIGIFGRKQDNPAIVLAYAGFEGLYGHHFGLRVPPLPGFEGLFLGTFSYIVANWMVSGISAGALISQAVVGTLGVFFGMLVVYKTGAIRVTPKFTRFLVAAIFGVAALALVNFLLAIFDVGGDFGPLRSGGPMAYLLLDFDQADQAIRAGAPEKAAWGFALGLTVTLVWLYTEILWLLSMFNSE